MMVKGIIYSLVKKCKHQNSQRRDYVTMCRKLIRRHIARGWSPSIMKDFILQADAKL